MQGVISYLYLPFFDHVIRFLKKDLTLKKAIPSAFFAALFVLSGFNAQVYGASASLSWDANSESDLSGYKVYFGSASGSYGTPVDVGNATTHTLSGLSDGTYYFAVTAYDSSGNESGFSTEVNKTFTSSDTTAPLISGITAGSITETGATISWSTNEASDTQIQYGTTTAYGSETTLNTTMVTSHSEALSSLAPATLYHFRVLSRDAAGNLTTSGDNTFTTATPPDTTPPAISGIASSNIGTTSATITWTTDEASDTRIEYGTSTAYGTFSTLNPSLITSHSQDLSGLSPNTTYHFRVLSRDAADNLATSGNNTFNTASPSDTTPPVASGITASNIGTSSAVITWATDEGASSQVEYGTTTSYGLFSSLGTSLVTSHSRSLSGLSNNTTYQYRIISKDSAGNTVTSGNNSFTTSSSVDTTAPVISSINAGGITGSGATISWTTNEAATSKVEYGTTTAYGSSTTLDNTLRTNHSQTLSGLSASTTIHYRVISQDGSGNTSLSGDNTLTTGAATDSTGPVISNVTILSTSSNSVTITWTTDEVATSQIEYGTTTAYGSSTTKNETLQISHNQTLTGLLEDTQYHFKIKSADGFGNLTETGDTSLQTAKSGTGDTTPPGDITAFTATGGDREVRLSWSNPSDTDFAGVRVRFRTDQFPTDINDGELFGDISGEPGAAISMTHQGLSAGVTYYYLAASYDHSGNFQTTVFVSAKTQGTAQNNTSSTSGGGGCGMIKPNGGEPPKPGDAAAMLSLIGILVLVWLKKGFCKMQTSIFKA